LQQELQTLQVELVFKSVHLLLEALLQEESHL
jgi:hypothetical protein